MVQGLHFGPFRDSWAHLCIDMQAMFAQRTAWHAPWLYRILPNVVIIAKLDPCRSIFTRFVPARRAEDAPGSWGRYYQRGPTMTCDQLDPDLITWFRSSPGLCRQRACVKTGNVGLAWPAA